MVICGNDMRWAVRRSFYNQLPAVMTRQLIMETSGAPAIGRKVIENEFLGQKGGTSLAPLEWFNFSACEENSSASWGKFDDQQK